MKTKIRILRSAAILVIAAFTVIAAASTASAGGRGPGAGMHFNRGPGSMSSGFGRFGMNGNSMRDTTDDRGMRGHRGMDDPANHDAADDRGRHRRHRGR